ncbi:ABC transporter I family member 11, chloroplastic isoform X4 [Vitis vinifera]|uniref:ABC transporter I family member 11, chloroplastic isoform X4 n=1 Tax=Vitis vinifera TaxID=29760 RepID=UPI0008FEC666|nr:ABC transporter I family member 11, chloroplastic isoform X4 [Vitis vinifera]|eukprot:XP_019080850.1 PREDICTED: ABC transporter I family member 11, chloroplastic isoform X4 [Vitis vinifera]
MTNYVCKAQPPPTAVSSASYFGHSLFFHSPPAILTRPCRSKFWRIRNLRISCEYSCIEVRGVSYRPQGTEFDLLNDVNFSLPEKSFGLIFGRSGSGKTTLLQLLAGINKPTSGSIFVQKYGDDGKLTQTSEPLPSERVGILFQFPERYFVADNVLEEVTFGWPRQRGSFQLKEHLALGLERAINWVQIPDLLILDEPLAGLDWKARADVVELLKHLKKELTILVVSHDLKELAALVDRSWRMEMGGVLKEEPIAF